MKDSAFKRKVDRRGGFVELSTARADDLALRAAAYLMMPRAHAVLGRAGRLRLVRLWAVSGGLEGLAEEFELHYADQRQRWQTARAALPIRLETLRRASALAEEAGGRPEAQQPSLSEEQKAEIARLLAEEAADPGPKDPLGIAQPWDQRQRTAP